MRSLIFILTVILFNLNSLCAQTLKAEQKEVYPNKYTFEEAENFYKKGEYEKAIWFYINLFPENRSQVIEVVKGIAIKLDSVDMSKFIKKSFALYASFDPTITSFNNGGLNMNMDELQKKGAWGDELIQKISDPNKPLNSAAEYNFRGLDKFKEGKIKEAIEDFDKAIEIKPTGQVYYNRAYSKSLVEDFNGAIQDYNVAIQLQYRLAEAYFERGYCKSEMNNFEEAIEDYTKAIEVNKNYADAYNNRAFVKLNQKDYKAAIKDFDKAIKISPDFVGAYMNRGFAKNNLVMILVLAKIGKKLFN